MKTDVTSATVLAALREGLFRSPAHAWLYEVNNGTGWNGGRQFADALVVSVYPSRGLWFAGVEVKVSRSDWKRELDKPTKSAEIQKWCDFWWAAAPEGVVEPAEVPENWGLIIAGGKGKPVVVKQAPKLQPEPLTQMFVASILRNQAQSQDAARLAGRDEGRQSAKAEYDVEAVADIQEKLSEALQAKRRAEQELQYKTSDYDTMVRTVRAFESQAGMPEHTISASARWNQESNVAAQFKAAVLLAAQPPERLARQYRDIADAFDALAVSAASAKGAA